MVISTPELAFEFFKINLTNSHSEELWIAALDSNSTVISSAMLFKGTVNYCLFHPRDIFRFVILHNSVSFLLAHNHPSNSSLPSPEDIELTRRIYCLSQLMQIPLLDHIITTKDSFYSFSRGNHFKKWNKLKLPENILDRHTWKL